MVLVDTKRRKKIWSLIENLAIEHLCPAQNEIHNNACNFSVQESRIYKKIFATKRISFQN